MKTHFLDRTANGLPIPAFDFGEQGPSVLIVGGVHGDEPEGVEASYGLIRRWQSRFDFNLRLRLIPALNVDGLIRHRRLNGNGVDLNRNLGTRDWSPEIKNPRYPPGPHANSEPENQALIRVIEDLQPVFILSLHSWEPVLNTNGDCAAEAEAIARLTHYRISPSIGYPTPGCLGTYAGIERPHPTLTYEIERGLAPREILSLHLDAIEAGLRETEKRRSP